MGTWGIAIFSDDVACDVRDCYKEILKTGMDEPEATKKIIKDFKGELDDFEEGPVFWLALASVQWQYGRLQDKVRKKALDIIKKGSDLERWEEDPKDLEKRKTVLGKLKEKIESPQPPPKRIPKKREWKWKPLPPDEIEYPFVPKSSKYLLPGQYWGILLSNGSFGCGRIIQVHPVQHNAFIAGLMDWVGKQHPDEKDIAGHSVIEQGDAHIKTIRENGGEILGYRPLEKDGIEPWTFRSAEIWNPQHSKLMRGYDVLRSATYKEWEKYPTFSTWGYNVIRIVAEKHLVKEF